MPLFPILGIAILLSILSAACTLLACGLAISLREINCKRRTGYPNYGAIVRDYERTCINIENFWGDFDSPAFLKMRKERKRLEELIDQEQERRSSKAA
jgi:hypothetical protein